MMDGLQNRFRESLSAVGTDVLYVSRMPWVVLNDFFSFRNRPHLDLREARALYSSVGYRPVGVAMVEGRVDLWLEKRL